MSAVTPIPARHKDVNRAKVCDDNFIEFVRNWQGDVLPKPTPDEPILDGSACSARDFDELFRSQLISRHLDLMARVLRVQQKVFYTTWCWLQVPRQNYFVRELRNHLRQLRIRFDWHW